MCKFYFIHLIIVQAAQNSPLVTAFKQHKMKPVPFHGLGQAGFFVEPSSATSLFAVKKLCRGGKIKRSESVVLMLTGSGLKDSEVFQHHQIKVINSTVATIESDVQRILAGENWHLRSPEQME